MRDRLKKLIEQYPCMSTAEDCFMESISDSLADYLLANGVIVPPCKVGDTIWDAEVNAWKVFAITIWQDCISLKTANEMDRHMRKTFTIGKHSIGKTIFLTREEAEQALKGR